MFALTIYLDTNDEEAADQARTAIVAALDDHGDRIQTPYAVDDDGPVELDGYDSQ